MWLTSIVRLTVTVINLCLTSYACMLRLLILTQSLYCECKLDIYMHIGHTVHVNWTTCTYMLDILYVHIVAVNFDTEYTPQVKSRDCCYHHYNNCSFVNCVLLTQSGLVPRNHLNYLFADSALARVCVLYYTSVCTIFPGQYVPTGIGLVDWII